METLTNYPLVIQLAGIVTLSAGLMIIITLTVLYFNRVNVKRKEQEFQEAELIILDELNNHILKYNAITEIPTAELSNTVGRLNALKDKNVVFKQSLVRLLVYFKLNLTGAITRIISSTYSRLKLREFTLGKLKSKFWFVKTQGLTEVQEMRDGHSISAVTDLLHDANEDVHVAAYSALLKLNSKSSFSFMNNEKEELSEWHQILLIDTITKIEGLGAPEFKVYLSTENKSIIHLCIKLIVHYQQFDAIPKLLSMLDHEDEHVRNQVICALGALNALNAEERLIDRYPLESNKNKSQILETLGRIASGSSINFIADKFLKAEHFSLLKSAAAAIIAHPIQLKDRILNSFTELDKEQEAVLKHYQEPLNLYGIH